MENHLEPHEKPMPPHVEKMYFQYLGMGSDRTYKGLAELIQKSTQLVNKYGSEYGWQQRIKDSLELDQKMMSNALTDTYIGLFEQVVAKEKEFLGIFNSLIEQTKQDIKERKLKIVEIKDLKAIAEIYHKFAERALKRSRPGAGNGFDQLIAGYKEDYTTADRIKQALLQQQQVITDAQQEKKEAGTAREKAAAEDRITKAQEQIIKYTKMLANEDSSSKGDLGEKSEAELQAELDALRESEEGGDLRSITSVTPGNLEG